MDGPRWEGALNARVGHPIHSANVRSMDERV